MGKLQQASLTLGFTLLFLCKALDLGATVPVVSSSRNKSIDESIPQEVACANRGEDVYLFLADKIAEKMEEKVSDDDLERLYRGIINSPIMLKDPTWGDLVDSIVYSFPVKSPFSKNVLLKGLPGLFHADWKNSKPKNVLSHELKGGEPTYVKYGRLAIINMAIKGEALGVDICGNELQETNFNEGRLSFDLNDFRTSYHALWISDLYEWFKNHYPNIDQRLFNEATKWKDGEPIFVEGAVGDRDKDSAFFKDVIYVTNPERLDRIATEYSRKIVKWFEIDWSKSGVGTDGKVVHPSIISEHTNFSAQFFGAVELVHLMSRTNESGKGLQIMAFSAGVNVLLMAAQLYEGLGKGGSPFGNVILVQGSISPVRDLTPIINLTSKTGRVIITRNIEDTYYLGSGTKSAIGFAGGGVLFGRGESLGLKGVSKNSSLSKWAKRVEVWDIDHQTTVVRGRLSSYASDFNDSIYTKNAESEHWHWFSRSNLRRLMKVLKF